ncbi:hypothetical protein LCGC14_1001180 [marine sediment metagenome]|uniref:PD-(D/E)XK endonuclease-like domain-containing protein n=1 Tax=marine sediment metagenome TaxID=412755 RepID=A0A0F9NPF1_9ZZZZ
MTKPTNTLTSTSLGIFGLCQVKYHWKYERRLRPIRETAGEALTVGSAFHVGMDADDVDDGLTKLDAHFEQRSKAILDEDWFAEDALRAKVRAMVMRSWERWPDRPELRESVFHCELPARDGKASEFEYAGKIDGLATGEVYDYKSLAKAVEFFASNRLSYQPTGYLWALGKEGHEVDRIVYRLIERPTIRRKIGRKKAGKRGPPESADEYEERCLEWLDEPGHIAEEEFFFTDAKAQAFEEHLRLITEQILFIRERGSWMRNPHACRTWSRDCEYIGLCTQVADGTPLADVHTDGYEVGDAHPELTPDVIVANDEGPEEKAPF